MNDQQLWGLLLACALVMVPLGILMGRIVRLARTLLDCCLPPRHLHRVGIRRAGDPERSRR